MLVMYLKMFHCRKWLQAQPEVSMLSGVLKRWLSFFLLSVLVSNRLAPPNEGSQNLAAIERTLLICSRIWMGCRESRNLTFRNNILFCSIIIVTYQQLFASPYNNFMHIKTVLQYFMSIKSYFSWWKFVRNICNRWNIF